MAEIARLEELIKRLENLPITNASRSSNNIAVGLAGAAAYVVFALGAVMLTAAIALYIPLAREVDTLKATVELQGVYINAKFRSDGEKP